MDSGQPSNASGSGSGNVKTWLKALLHAKTDREPHLGLVPGPASLSPPASSDMISFHHTMDDEEDRPPFLPPPRSFSGGLGATSYASASQRTLAQPIATPTLSRSRSSEVASLSSQQTPSPGSSPSKLSSTGRSLSQSISSLSSLIKGERRASSNYRQVRSGSVLNLVQDLSTEAGPACELPTETEHILPSSSAISGSQRTGVDANVGKLPLPSRRASSFGESDPAASAFLLPEGETMLKVTHKKVKTRNFRLDADRGQIIWESKRNTIVNLESIREVRFGPSAASYRTSLNISSAHEPRWITIIYQNVGIYKALHLIALSDASVARWRSSLLHLQTLRRELTGAVGASSSLEHRRVLWMRHHWKDADQSSDEKLSLEEVTRLCRGLGIESSNTHLKKCFDMADHRDRRYLDFEDFQHFVSLLKRRADVQGIFDTLAKQTNHRTRSSDSNCSTDTVAGITEDAFKLFVRLEQGNTAFKDDQIHDLFVRHRNNRLSHSEISGNAMLMDFDGFLDFLSSSDNPPLLDQLPLFSTMAASETNDALVSDSSTMDGTKIDAASTHRGNNSALVQHQTPSRAFADTAEELIAAGPSSSHATTHKVAAHLRKSTVQHDMKRPLSEYYISSSHNTYLVGGQWKGSSTVEGYIRALLQGARSVELDCWDGPNMTPQITHGRTLTSRVAFQDVISAIARYAFVTSPYPLILSLEVHADPPQQDVMARILVDTLGEMLLTQPLGNSKEVLSQEDDLPSPEDLRFKVLIKAKNILVPEPKLASTAVASTTTSLPTGEVIQAVFDNTTSTSATETSTTDSERDTQPLSGAKNLMRRVTRQDKTSKAVNPTSAQTAGEAGRRESKKLMSTALASLLIYTVGVKCRGFNKKESYATQHMISLSEKSALKFIEDTTARDSLIKHNRTHLTRVYPSMTSFARLHASRNFVPLDMWAAGCQLAALNWQTADLGFELNQAMFSRNGRCGYVLKPSGLRKKEQMKVDTEKYLRFSLDVRIISAQQLPKKKGDSSKEKESDSKEPIDPFVAITLIAPHSWGRQPRGLLRQVSSNRVDGERPDLRHDCDSGDGPCTQDLRGRVSVSESLGSPGMHLGVTADCNELLAHSESTYTECSQLRTPTIRGNGFSPQWDTSLSVLIDVPAGANSAFDAKAASKLSRADLAEFSRDLLDLCFVRFEIYDDDLEEGSILPEQTYVPSTDKQGTARKDSQTPPALLGRVSSNSNVGSVASSASSTSSIEADCVAAFAASVGALQQGYRHLPLYDSQLSQYLFSTLFIHSRLRFVGVVSKPSK